MNNIKLGGDELFYRMYVHEKVAIDHLSIVIEPLTSPRKPDSNFTSTLDFKKPSHLPRYRFREFPSLPGKYESPTGVILGEMTNELECYDLQCFISEFVSVAPKSYAFQVVRYSAAILKTECKVCKGYLEIFKIRGR